MPVLKYSQLKFTGIIGRGASGTVRRAIYKATGEDVAVKEVVARQCSTDLRSQFSSVFVLR